MSTVLTRRLPAEALEQLMAGYCRRNPALFALLADFGVLVNPASRRRSFVELGGRGPNNHGKLSHRPGTAAHRAARRQDEKTGTSDPHHRIPGGAIELSAHDRWDYWAHIIVNHDFALPDQIDGMEGPYAEIVGSKIDYEYPAEPSIVEVPHKLRQIAILMKPGQRKF